MRHPVPGAPAFPGREREKSGFRWLVACGGGPVKPDEMMKVGPFDRGLAAGSPGFRFQVFLEKRQGHGERFLLILPNEVPVGATSRPSSSTSTFAFSSRSLKRSRLVEGRLCGRPCHGSIRTGPPPGSRRTWGWRGRSGGPPRSSGPPRKLSKANIIDVRLQDRQVVWRQLRYNWARSETAPDWR